ncbi:TetR/AcrR family transcriptional regulator [Endozoicomonas sp. OPT23]|uniref:TetR/AcrR family transcriptional regulator n=1 Tax=Endozoicomonas sp. OPT23 TaxID=2072845 RepID=UPI00129AD207|nr:TetR/AcrR family transcriptional regulator [Endozoicomonas sp. OPT23]MRI33176.1 TetR/AcrR family transcriptional regulator [Endozoicomonas sp. OPT23]
MSNEAPVISARGRPADEARQEEQKRKLMMATQELMEEKSYKSITIRELGDKAGVNSAMIRYYFGSKEGLVQASLQNFMSSHFAELQPLLEMERPVKPFIQFVSKILNQNAILARLIHDEILNDESPLREVIISGFPSRIAQTLPGLIQREVHQQQPDIEINWKYAAFNLMSMLILPYMGAPVRKMAWGITDEELVAPEWTDHVYQQFMSGCLNREH